MDYTNFLKKAKSNEVAGIYIFQGKEDYLAKNTIEYLRNNLINKDVLEFNYFETDATEMTYSELYSEIVRLPFMSDKRLLILTEWDELSKYISKNYDELEKMKDTYILILLSSPDSPRKNLSIVKTLSKYDRIVDFNMVSQVALKNWVLRKFKQLNKEITNSALDKFLIYINYNKDSVYNSLYKVDNEIKKVSAVSLDTIDVDIVENIVNQSVSANIFRLTDAIGNKNKKAAIKELENLYDIGEEPVKILYMVSRYFQNLLKISRYKEQNYKIYDINRMIGLSKYEFDKLTVVANKLKYSDACNYVKMCKEADWIIKTIKNEPKITLFKLIISLSS